MDHLFELDQRFTEEPTELYGYLRRHAPVCPVLLHGGARGWLVTRYADAVELLRDGRISKDHVRALDTCPSDTTRPYMAALHRNMLGSDPPKHTRLRKLVVKAFSARSVGDLRPRIESIADDLLDRMDARGPVDLIAEYAAPLPIRVISDLLGMSADDGHAFRSVVGPLTSIASDSEKHRAEQEVTAILRDVIARKRSQPGRDLLTALLDASDDGDSLSEEELVATAFLLIVAGYETTVNLIGNGALALLRNPSQLAAVQERPGLLKDAVEEILRFDGPINIATTRYTTERVTVGGVTIPAGEMVLIALLSANRDDAVFPAADRFDIFRRPRAHLAFGHGIHFCVGASLARLEGCTALGRLLTRYPDIALVSSETVYQSSILLRGVLSLPVMLDGRAACSRPPERPVSPKAYRA